MKIYTKTGDGGTTSLIGGERVAKCDPRVEAYGTVDELMAFVALLTDTLVEDARTSCFVEPLQRIESQLMTVSALFAVGKGGEGKVAPIAEERIAELETLIDAMQAEIPAITKFTIPGGHKAVSLCHVCCTVCRRAERAALRAQAVVAVDAQDVVAVDAQDVVAVDAQDVVSVDTQAVVSVDAQALKYLNRLSDYLYTLGRVVTERLKVEERLWIP